ncbi:MAG: hypothetical protein JNN05_00295 [Candidatus Omnitrophica bacterium]|nr:hypothetical protein [Candidatus Omnitrophota bacterium]
MRKDYLIIGVALFIAFSCHHWSVNRGKFEPGVVAPNEPRQVIDQSLKAFSFLNYTIHPVATFEIKALVLSDRHYFWGEEAKLAPVDLALGWGPMSDGTVLKNISVSQGVRWYFFYYQKSLIDQSVIVSHSGNMHMIPANKEIEKALKQAKKGNVISFKGYLVNITKSDGWRWNSSLSRTDTGAGSCEVVWVSEFEILER